MDAHNIINQQRCRKLDWICIGPCEILEVISPWAYCLKLPKDLYNHPVQPISCLTKSLEDPLPGYEKLPLPAVIVDGEEEYKVEHIKDSRIFTYQVQYLVKWKGYDDRSWKSVSNVDGLQSLDTFHAEQSQKPGSIPL